MGRTAVGVPALFGFGCAAGGFARLASTAVGGFFVVAVALHVARQSLALTKALETLEELLDGLAAAWFDFDHL